MPLEKHAPEPRYVMDPERKKNIFIGVGIGLLIVGTVLIIWGLDGISTNRQEAKELAIIEAQALADKAQEDAEILKELTRQANIDDCVEVAYELYSNDWDKRCESRGREADCNLNNYDYTDLNDGHDKRRNECYKRY